MLELSGLSATTPARAALAGNPSDGYGGAVLATTIEPLVARVTVEPADQLQVDVDILREAAFAFSEAAGVSDLPVSISHDTTIPALVGLAGSSALVVACLRALAEHFRVPLGDERIPEVALHVENTRLGNVAGPQDSLVQTVGGLVLMDFASGSRARAPRADLPLVVAWHAGAADRSGKVHSDLRARYDADDAVVAAGMAELAEVARHAFAAVERQDLGVLGACMDRTFDIRVEMTDVPASQIAMVKAARMHGVPVNSAGSGGSIVGLCRSAAQRDAVRTELEGLGCEVLDLYPPAVS